MNVCVLRAAIDMEKKGHDVGEAGREAEAKSVSGWDKPADDTGELVSTPSLWSAV